MTKNVIFDIGAVLIDWNPSYLYSKMLPDKTAIAEFFEEVDFAGWNRGLDAGGRWGDAVLELSGRFPHRRELIEAAHLRWHEMLPGAIDGTVAILEQLADKETPLYAITNYSSEKWVETCRRFPFFRHFRDIVVSGDERLLKPDPAIYHICLERNGLNAQDCIFIDDSPKNVEGANAIGIHGIHFETPEKLADDLAELGFLP
ncbi:MAG TPA: HAD family phosphatase [Hyphomicrobiales bacterium]|nr:HAD family phosphatase [Hyphomicrobiales bacterium]